MQNKINFIPCKDIVCFVVPSQKTVDLTQAYGNTFFTDPCSAWKIIEQATESHMLAVHHGDCYNLVKTREEFENLICQLGHF